MLATLNIYPFFKQLLEDFDTYCLLADKNKNNNKKIKKYKEVWQAIDRSLPIIIETELTKLRLDQPEVWFVRVLNHPIKGICMDLRQFVKIEDELTDRFIPTENGITLSTDEWQKVLDPLFKMLRKHFK